MKSTIKKSEKVQKSENIKEKQAHVFKMRLRRN